jgi:hypothetical protein
MKRTIGRIVMALAFITALSSAAGIASADPIRSPRSFVEQLACDNGVTYEVVVTGAGLFTPAHDLASNSILVPTEFGEFHGVLTDAQGNVLEEFTDPPLLKGNAPQDHATSVTCTFDFEETFTDPELGLVTFQGEGSVIAFVTPVR